jgi:hypothetical protein
MHNISNLFYFWNNTLHVSAGLSVHHQEIKTVHTASVYVIQVQWLLANGNEQPQDLYDIYMMLYVQS